MKEVNYQHITFILDLCVHIYIYFFLVSNPLSNITFVFPVHEVFMNELLCLNCHLEKATRNVKSI